MSSWAEDKRVRRFVGVTLAFPRMTGTNVTSAERLQAHSDRDRDHINELNLTEP